jgi:hypothetical protein
MNNRYASLDDFMQSVCSKDTNVRLSIFPDLEEYLQNEHSILKCSDLIKFCDSILLWVSSSNFKVAINGLRIVHLLIERLPDKLLTHAIESKNILLLQN